MKTKLFISFILLLASYKTSLAYPVDGYDETGISRLDGYFHSLTTASSKREITSGALLGIPEINLSLSRSNASVVSDARLSSGLKEALDSLNAKSASVSLIDFSTPNQIHYAGNKDTARFIPGSVGKVFIAASLFKTLARLYPNSISQRRNILRSKQVTATDFVIGDSHVVPFWDVNKREIFYRELQVGDTANIWTYLDWMLSASSNAAASMLMREVILMNHFLHSYPVSTAEENSFIESASPTDITRLMRKSFAWSSSFQGSAFTKAAKKRFPSIGSTATTKDLAKLLLSIEQDRFIDTFSSIELKRLLYATQKRVRYAAAPELHDAAVYFKSGSLYSCKPEAGFACGKYKGNKKNLLNSASLIEFPAGNPRHRYISVISTNILKRNSEELHKQLAAAIHKLILSNAAITETAENRQVSQSGRYESVD